MKTVMHDGVTVSHQAAGLVVRGPDRLDHMLFRVEVGPEMAGLVLQEPPGPFSFRHEGWQFYYERVEWCVEAVMFAPGGVVLCGRAVWTDGFMGCYWKKFPRENDLFVGDQEGELAWILV